MKHWEKRQRAFRTIENLSRALNPIAQHKPDECEIYLTYGFNKGREHVLAAYAMYETARSLQRKLNTAFMKLRER